jgi:hypothetical protein
MRPIRSDVLSALERIKPGKFADYATPEEQAKTDARIRLEAIPSAYRNAVIDVMERRLPDGATFRDFRKAWHRGERRIWVWGPMGCGKSTAMAWAAIKLLDSAPGNWCCWFSVDLAEHYHENQSVRRDLFADAINAPFCAIDDAHKSSSLWPNIATRIGGVINARYQDDKPTMVASIAPPSVVGEKLGHDIVDRFPCVIEGRGESMREHV